MRRLAAAVVFALVIGASFGFSLPSTLLTADQSAFVPVPCATREWVPAEEAFSARPGARAFTGRFEGGLYKIEIPDKWNGELVLWAHGYVPATGTQGLQLRAQDDLLRNHLIDRGFAWAAASYRCNGYIPGQAFVDTTALLDVFRKVSEGRTPTRTYFTGISMGGFATLIAMHEAPEKFDGGLALCSAGPELMDFFDDAAKSAAELAGIKPTQATLNDDMKMLIAALGSPAGTTQVGKDAANRQIAYSGGPRPFAAEGALERDTFAGNISTGRAALVSPRVAKYSEERPFTGRISKPLLTMHTTGDLFVPIFLEQRLKTLVAGAGRSQFLVQRIYRAAGHCTFSPAESAAAFDDLVAWVRNGRVPAGDEVMGDLSDAGRRFTNPLRPGDPGGLIVR